MSRVINQPDKASAAIREKVNAVIEEHKYVPNITASNLFAGNSKTIAIFVLDIDNPFYVSLIKHLNKIALQNQYTLLVCNTENDPEIEKEYLRYCDGIRIKGIIVTEGYSNTTNFENISNSSLVFLERDMGDKYSTVSSENEKGIRMLVDYLYNLHHRKIAFIGYDKNIKSMHYRREAFDKALKEKGIDIPAEYIYPGIFSTNTGAKAVDYLCSLSDKPTAVICANDQIARGFILRASKLGLNIPTDFSVAGFDGYNPEYFHYDLTTIVQDIADIARHLFDCVSTDKETPTRHFIDVSLLIGDTCKKV